MAKVFINGAGGFFGAHLVEHFLREGHEVTACGRPKTDLGIAERAGARIARADVLEAASLAPVLRGHDVVVNVAGIFDMSARPEVLERVNHQGTRNLGEALAGSGVRRLVQISTVAVYGPPKAQPCPEDAEKRPNNAYGLSKWRGEQAAFELGAKHGFEVTAIRPMMVYGPRAHYGHVTYLMLAALHAADGGKRVPMLDSGPKVRSVHIEDVCRAAHLVAFHDGAAGEAFNVADDTTVDLRGFLAPFLEAYGLRPSPTIKYIPPLWRAILKAGLALLPQDLPLLNRRLARDWKKLAAAKGLETPLVPRVDKDFMYFVLSDLVVDNSKIKRLGFSLRYPDYRAGMAETIAWYRRERWLP